MGRAGRSTARADTDVIVATRYYYVMPPIPLRPPSLTQYPSYLAAQLAKAASRVLDERLADHELRLHHFAVLACLDDLGLLCQRDLSERLDIDKSHVVGFVDDLERRGLIQRERDAEDRRRYRIAITPAGAALLTDLHAAHDDTRETVVGALTESEQAALVELLAKVVAHADRQRLGVAG